MSTISTWKIIFEKNPFRKPHTYLHRPLHVTRFTKYPLSHAKHQHKALRNSAGKIEFPTILHAWVFHLQTSLPNHRFIELLSKVLQQRSAFVIEIDFPLLFTSQKEGNRKAHLMTSSVFYFNLFHLRRNNSAAAIFPIISAKCLFISLCCLKIVPLITWKSAKQNEAEIWVSRALVEQRHRLGVMNKSSGLTSKRD